MNLNTTLKPLVAAAALVCAGQAFAQVTFYEGEGFRGRVFAANRQVTNFVDIGFNDRASSVIVDRGRWEVCEDAGFHGKCVILRKGSYDSLRGMGLEQPDLVGAAGEQQRPVRRLPAGTAARADL